jgi:gentisate 1,2-dioxygenase
VESVTEEPAPVVGSLDELHELLRRQGMGPGWNKPEPSLYPLPKRAFVPAHWPYRAAREALHAAGGLVSTEFAERRNLILANPVPGNTYGTTRTLVAAYQMVRGHEVARSHRHTPNALRLALDCAPGTYTVVQGRKYPMEPGDVLLTPNWLWHGHSNESDRDAYWIDFLDAPLVQLLDPMFFEHFPDGIERTDEVAASSPMRFAWAETARRLDGTLARDGVTEVALEGPGGAPALDTIALAVLRLSAGATTPPLRTTANAIVAVIEGHGESEIDGTRFTWERGDVIAVPAWRQHVHRAGQGGAHLLRVSDEPVMRKLNWLRSSN